MSVLEESLTKRKMADPYIGEINSLDAEIKRITLHLKELREQKQKALDNLYNYMINHNLESVSNGSKTISIKTCRPKELKPKTKSKKKRKEDAIELFREVGIPNPIEFWNQFTITQKSIPTTPKDDYELGF